MVPKWGRDHNSDGHWKLFTGGASVTVTPGMFIFAFCHLFGVTVVLCVLPTNLGREKEVFTAEQVYKHNGDNLPKNQRTAKVCLLCPDSCIVRHKHDTHITLGFESVEEVPSASRLQHVPGVGPNCNQQARKRQGKEEKIVVFFSLSLTL